MAMLTERQEEVLPDLASYLEHHARAFPGKPAIRHPDGTEPGGTIHYRTLTYGALQEQVETLAAGFLRSGIGRGTKTVLMASPGPDLFALAFALFRIGAVPVVVDPGMGVRRMLHCYRTVGAEAFIGPPAAHAVRVLSRRTFADARIRVTVGRRWFWGGHTLNELRRPAPSAEQAGAPKAAERRPAADDLLMIGFTTGSTGPAKGVEYTHRMAAAMARGIASAHRRSREEVSLVTLPLYGILDLVFGSTLVVAPVAPARVAGADPGPVVAALERFGVSTMFASPALLRVLGEHLRQHPTALPELRCVVSGGAPVPAELVALLRDVLDDAAEIHTTYGATEALPISSLESAELLGETAARAARGDGTCVGRPVPGVDVRIVRTTDGPLPLWERALRVRPGEVGEIAVAGAAVSRRYHAAPAADAQHKIQEPPGDGGAARIWHRTGDLGSLDDKGRLWFAGRRTQRVTTADGDLHTVRCEGVFHAHPLVRRTALVGVGAAGAQRPVLCVETEPGTGRKQWRTLVPELRELAAGNPQTRHVQDFLRHPGFPVDPRHNAKIGREQLARWAGRHLGRGRGHRRTALRAIPLAGWAFLLLGAVRPFHSPVLTALWWADAFLSVVVHAAQLPQALPRGRAAGRGTAATVGLTMLYGATWWRTLPPATPAHRSVDAGEEAA
ncbi:fatty acid CoA ligase family protein [Streptomyces sp. NBC_01456]|uniref:fatty acid CoA ligase family protein n=1 Tax=unclassified Streptomyces TaxID=2593676 RepID=UPI002E36EC9E|nr:MULTISPECIES: fatty acid CoA ligase family protein [unclassified Streptomyces]